jgi:hypothetical protein
MGIHGILILFIGRSPLEGILDPLRIRVVIAVPRKDMLSVS